MVLEPDLEWTCIVKAHQHRTGAASREHEAIGKSKGGNTTKIHMATDANGFPIRFEITGGEVHDCKISPEIIEQLPSAEQIRKKSSNPVILRKKNSKMGNADIDWSFYKYRHLVENLFARIKHFRGIATRFDKLKRNYESVIALVCVFFYGSLFEMSTAPRFFVSKSRFIRGLIFERKAFAILFF